MSRRALAGAATIALAACAMPTDREPLERELTGAVASPIVHGIDSPAAEDAVVLVMHYDAIQIGGGAAGCTGTLLTPRLVLTARHCVAETDTSAACDSAGNPVFGGTIKGDNPAAKLYAFAGNQRPDFLSGLDKAARGAELVDDASKTLCNHDIALLLLDRPLAGGKTAPLRLDGGPRQGETVTVVGWGVSDKDPTPPTRQQRAGVKVLAVGPADGLGPAEFRLGESACAGDSGGPAISETTGAVLGVLSRGGNGSMVQPGDVAGCINAENVFTSVAGYGDLIRSAYDKAGQAPWLEGQPDPATLPPAPAPKSGGCSMERPRRGAAGALQPLLLAALAIAACVTRRRSRF